MKKGLVFVFMGLFLMTFVLAQSEVPTLYIKVDMDKKALVRFVDPSSFEVYDQIPIMEDYQGISVTPMPTYTKEVDIRVYLKDRESGEFKYDDGELFSEGPFDTTEDVYLDYRGGILKMGEISPPSEEVVEETIEATNVEENLEEGKDAKITGNVINGSGNVSIKSLVWGIVIIAFIALIATLIVNGRRKQLMQKMPEEKELEQLERQASAKGKAIGKIREEQKLKARIESKKRRAAMKIAKEDAELAELNKEGAQDRRRESERFDNKKGGGGFY